MLAALLAGVALTSIAIGRTADRVGRRRWYAALFLVMGIAGAAFALTFTTASAPLPAQAFTSTGLSER